jgi:hypothetical protein
MSQFHTDIDSEGEFFAYLKNQFNSFFIQKIQIGQTQDYEQIKLKLSEIFEFCSKSEDLNNLPEKFLIKDIMNDGIFTV